MKLIAVLRASILFIALPPPTRQGRHRFGIERDAKSPHNTGAEMTLPRCAYSCPEMTGDAAATIFCDDSSAKPGKSFLAT